jgi:hypothetical protein
LLKKRKKKRILFKMEKKKTPYFLRIFVATYIFFNITLATLLSLSSQVDIEGLVKNCDIIIFDIYYY